MSFKDEDEVARYIGGIFQEAFKDEELGPTLADTGLVVSFRYTEPDAVLTVDMGNHQVYQGERDDVDPSATMYMKAETANAYWQGAVNLPFAIARGKVTVEGNVASLLKLAPLGSKLFSVYTGMLERDGRQDLLVDK
ncbi:SCP-2 sterol transfer family protein [Haloechinothrix alba]|uniref:SCP-2 sterol transfer family protein n=1 Tax=Haloechinothrix alba TaxID=664784 RepID=A0A238ZJN2_9PSEU|nr:SCP2 sterol-binding domain-containing protein [Haloechinothrix alba]SNR82903.1 SCP-2 sterol transfer family protein [Haloechinothrix alba]